MPVVDMNMARTVRATSTPRVINLPLLKLILAILFLSEPPALVGGYVVFTSNCDGLQLEIRPLPQAVLTTTSSSLLSFQTPAPSAQARKYRRLFVFAKSGPP